MVDVGAKPETARVAIASAGSRWRRRPRRPSGAGTIGKGDVLGIARVAGIQAAKRAPDLHPAVSSAAADRRRRRPRAWPAMRVEITATVRAFDRTGVEMEALAAVSAAALTVYDMCKAIDRGMVIGAIRLDEKRGGKSGTYLRDPGRQPAKKR